MMKTIIKKSFWVALSLVVAAGLACNGSKTKKDVKDPTDVTKEDPFKKIVVSKKVKRKITADAKSEFKAAVKAYVAAKNAGNLAGQCAALAERFSGLYEGSPKMVEAKFNQGTILEQCGRVSEAKKVYEQILRRHPNHGPSLNNLGVMAFKAGQRGVAEQRFKRAAAVKNSWGYANIAMLGRQSALRGNTAALKDAVADIHRSLAVDSSNIDAYNMLATMVYDHARNKSQLEIARLITVQAIKQDPKYASLYNVLGLVLLRMNAVTRALKQFRKAAALDSRFVEAHMNIGAITLSFRDYNTAANSFQAVLAQNPPKSVKRSATVGLGVAYRGQGKFQQALQQYLAAQKMDPSDDSIAYNIGILKQDYMFDASNPVVAISQLQESLQLLQRYMSSARHKKQRKDAKRRIKNIKEMIPMLREQQKMMQSMQKGGS